ncbi:MAG: hypothetical protein AABZ67_00585 [Pseudomonadota bacterium]
MAIRSLEDLIKLHEGFRGYIYDDATGEKLGPGDRIKGNPTFGWGFALSVNPATQGECGILLAIRLSGAANDAALAVGREAFKTIAPARQAALADMAYQMGRQRLEGFNLMLDAIRRGDWDRARDEALASRWARQTPARARAVADMLLTGNWPGDTPRPMV